MGIRYKRQTNSDRIMFDRHSNVGDSVSLLGTPATLWTECVVGDCPHNFGVHETLWAYRQCVVTEWADTLSVQISNTRDCATRGAFDGMV